MSDSLEQPHADKEKLEPYPCPFCGSFAIDTTGTVATDWQWIFCLSCGAAGPGADTSQEAIARWNAASYHRRRISAGY